MQHLLTELDIETEVIDPEILVAENQALRDEIAEMQSRANDLSKELYDMR